MDNGPRVPNPPPPDGPSETPPLDPADHDTSVRASSAPPAESAPASPYAPLFESRTDLSGLASTVDRLKAEVRKLLVGQAQFLDELVAAVLAGGHVLIEGVPGVAKTLTAKLLARAVSADFARLQFTPDLMPADVLGTTVFNPDTRAFDFHPGPVFGQLVLIDEINRAPAKTQAALFEVMEERQVTVDGTTYTMPQPFHVFATQNPIEHEGTYRLPEAQLDRFLFKIEVGYPTREDEAQILAGFQDQGGRLDLERVQPVLSAEEVLAAQAAVRALYVDPKLLGYIAAVVAQTRTHPALALGASPRASLALLTGAKAVAAMAGRDFVTPDDVRAVASPVLRHRLQLTAEREIEGVRMDTVVDRVVQSVEVPR
ncbi:MAG: MoxR family ATPase [Bacteroidota bacterium]